MTAWKNAVAPARRQAPLAVITAGPRLGMAEGLGHSGAGDHHRGIRRLLNPPPSVQRGEPSGHRPQEEG